MAGKFKNFFLLCIFNFFPPDIPLLPNLFQPIRCDKHSSCAFLHIFSFSHSQKAVRALPTDQLSASLNYPDQWAHLVPGGALSSRGVWEDLVSFEVKALGGAAWAHPCLEQGCAGELLVQVSRFWTPELIFNPPCSLLRVTSCPPAPDGSNATKLCTMPGTGRVFPASPYSDQAFPQWLLHPFSKFCKTDRGEIHPPLARQQKQLQGSHLGTGREKRMIVHELGFVHASQTSVKIFRLASRRAK